MFYIMRYKGGEREFGKSDFSYRCKFCLFVLGSGISAASFGMERRFKRTGVSGRWGYGDASWNHFGKIHSSKEISDTDRLINLGSKTEMSKSYLSASELWIV